jgi:hypothetical protein
VSCQEGKTVGFAHAPFRGDGDLYSTVQDYGKLVQMMLIGLGFQIGSNDPSTQNSLVLGA